MKGIYIMKEDKIRKRFIDLNVQNYTDNETDKIQKAVENTNNFLFALDGLSKKEIKKNIKGLKALKKHINNTIKDYSESSYIKGYKKDLKAVKMAINILKKELEARKYQDMALDMGEDIEEDYDEALETAVEEDTDAVED